MERSLLDAESSWVNGYPNARIFLHWAGSDESKWQNLVGLEVIHDRLGRGTVVSLRPLEISFYDDEKPSRKFTAGTFRNQIELPDVPIVVRKDKEGYREARESDAEHVRAYQEAEQERVRLEEQRKEEAQSREDFARLKSGFLARSFRDDNPASPLYRILILMRDKQPISEYDIQWLEDKKLHGVLALYHEFDYELTHNAWSGARASGAWRRYGSPERALRLSEPPTSEPQAAQAALLRSRVASLADLRNWNKAAELAERVRKLQPDTWGTWLVLGRVKAGLGQHEESQSCFDRAEQLGANSAVIDRTRRSDLKRSPQSERAITAGFLLARDPNRYRWAKAYAGEKHS